MPSTTVPYDMRLWIYPGANPSGTPTTWGLPLDVSAYVRYPGNDGGQAASYTVGRSDEASQVDAATLSLTLDNRTGLFSTKNVASTLYGKLRRNTPLVMGMTTGFDTFTRTVVGGIGTSDSGQTYTLGSFWSVDGAALNHTTTAANQASVATMNLAGSADFDMTFTTTIGAVATGAAVVASGLQQIDSSNYMTWKLNFQPAGVLEAQFQRIGGAGGTASTTAVTIAGGYAASDTWAVRCQRTGSDVRMKAWRPSSGSEPAAWTTTWVEPYIRAGELGLLGWRLVGNTNAGSYVLKFDNLTIVGLEFVGNVVQWPNRWNKTASNSWAPIQAAGILRRLQQGKGPIRSPLTRQLPAYGPTAYWPLEDDAGAAVMASNVFGVPPAYIAGVLPSGDNSLVGAGPAPTLSATSGVIRGKTSKRVTGGVLGFSAMWFTKFPGSLPASKTAVTTIFSTGKAIQYVFSVNATTTFLDAYDTDGTLLSSASGLFSPQDPNQWIAWQLETDVVAANTVWTLISHQVGQATYFFSTSSHASTVASSAIGFQHGGTNLPVGTAFSQTWLGPNTLPFVTDSFSLVSAGYLGETAGDRLTRLCFEEGISFTLEPGVTDQIGVQPQTNILQALRLAADADGGILYESGAGLGYRPRSARYKQAVDLALTVAARQIDEPPEPTDDDQRYRNKWTVTNDGGSYASAQDDAEIAANGLYEDAVTLTLFSDDQAAFQAGWRLYLGTYPDLRWPGLSLNFGANPSLIPSWRKRRYGMRIQVVTGLTQVQGSDPDVIVEGYTATLWPHGWTVSLNCSTAKAWDINTLDDDLERMDAASSTVQTAVATPTATSMVVTNNGDTYSTWAPTSTMPAEVPFTIQVNGEFMTVTNVGDLSGNNQTLTVTRGINGGAKTHAVGETVSLAYPMILAL